MARQRDYKAEYKRRIANATARGLTRSQARGHAKPAEKPARPSSGKGTKPDARLESALTRLRRGASLTEAAKSSRVSRERFRRFLADNALATRRGRRWLVEDDRPRRVPILSRGESRTVTVRGFSDASLAGAYANDVGRFLRSNNIDHLAPHRGVGVKDVGGKFHPFETDPNVVYRLASADLPAFHEIYEIVQ